MSRALRRARAAAAPVRRDDARRRRNPWVVPATSWAAFGRTTEPPLPGLAAAAAAEPATPGPAPTAAGVPRELARRPAVVKCMDSRLDLLDDLGQRRGDTMVPRSADATVSDDAERSLALTHESAFARHTWSRIPTARRTAGRDAATAGELRRGDARARGVLLDVSVRPLFCDLAAGAAVPVEPRG